MIYKDGLKNICRFKQKLKKKYLHVGSKCD